jgi:hypothetical protein
VWNAWASGSVAIGYTEPALRTVFRTVSATVPANILVTGCRLTILPVKAKVFSLSGYILDGEPTTVYVDFVIVPEAENLYIEITVDYLYR